MKTKRYIVRKYIHAKSAKEAIKLEKSFEPDDVFVDEKEWDKLETQSKPVAGFTVK